jgi:hypothetical protein
VRDIKDGECGRTRYKGRNLADQVGIFCFKGLFGKWRNQVDGRGFKGILGNFGL